MDEPVIALTTEGGLIADYAGSWNEYPDVGVSKIGDLMWILLSSGMKHEEDPPICEHSHLITKTWAGL